MMVRMFLLAGLVVLAPSIGSAQDRGGDAAGASVEVQRSRTSMPEVSRSRGKKIEAPQELRKKTPAAVNEQRLWKMLGEEHFDALRKEIAAIKASHPGWKPPAKLLRALELAEAEPHLWDLLHQARFDQALQLWHETERRHPGWHPSPAFRKEFAHLHAEWLARRAHASGDWAGVIAAAERYPEAFGCNAHQSLLWLADAWHHRGRDGQAAKLYAKSVRRCAPWLAVDALEHAADRLSPQRVLKLAAQLEKRRLSRRETRRLAVVEIRSLLALDELPEQAEERVAAIERRLNGERRLWAWTSLGWLYDRLGQARDALRVFRLAQRLGAGDDALAGELVSLAKLKRDRELVDLAREKRAVLRKTGKWADALPLIAQACARLHRDGCTIRSFAELERLRPLSEDESELLAWSLLRKGDAPQAARRFEALYRAKPTKKRAQGLRASLSALGEEQRVVQLAEELDGPLAGIERGNEARRLYDRRLFHAAQGVDEGISPALQHADSDWMRVGFQRRWLQANVLNPALDQFAFSDVVLEAGHYLSPETSIGVRVDRIQLDAGPPVLLPADHIGNGVLLPARVYPVRTRWSGYAWSLGWSKEGWSSWRVRLGQAFVGGPLPSTWQGMVEWSHKFERGDASVRLYRKPVRSTMLSWIGLQAPQAPIVWGRVSANGVLGRGYLSLRKGFGLYGEAVGELLDGVHVARNIH
ncbi:MAG: cellulose synthase subunit BcsC-related outer membrane protein, partial [Mariprofundaceae bacterium]